VWLMFMDESGNTGKKLDDPDQPIHWMVAVLVPEDHVLALSRDMDALMAPAEARLGRPVELHAVNLYRGKAEWKGVPPQERIDIADQALSLLAAHECAIIHACIDKTRLASVNSMPADRMDPHLLAFQFVLEDAEAWLAGQHDVLRQRALIVADETTEHDAYCVQLVKDMQRQQSDARGFGLEHVVDTAHFAKSQDSRGVQLADLVAYMLQANRRGGVGRSAQATARIVADRVAPLVVTWRPTWPPAQTS